MITGVLRRKSVLIKDERDASRLRNRGYTGKNMGTALSLNLPVAIYLLESGRIEVKSEGVSVGKEELKSMMSEEERMLFLAFSCLRRGGKNPAFSGKRLMWNGMEIRTFWFDGMIDFPSLGNRGYIAVVAEEGCVLYSYGLVFRGEAKDVRSFLEKRGYVVETGLKYGCDYRLYESSPHATTLACYGSKLAAKNIVARVRIAHSVRKIYVQIAMKNGKYTGYRLQWIR